MTVAGDAEIARLRELDAPDQGVFDVLIGTGTEATLWDRLALLSLGSGGWGDELLSGAAMTVVVALTAYGLGLLVGTLGAGAKLSGMTALRAPAEVYTTVIRGIPELLVIYLFFYGLEGGLNSALSWVRMQPVDLPSGVWITGEIERWIGQIYAEPIRLSPFIVGVTAVGLISGAYSTEVIRGAIRAVPPGQIEAARAHGMRGLLIFRRIVWPQALRLALPGLGNVWQLTLKDTALISVTSLTELMRQASVASGSTREPFIFFLTAAALYLLMTTFSNMAFQRAERHYSRGVRRA